MIVKIGYVFQVLWALLWLIENISDLIRQQDLRLMPLAFATLLWLVAAVLLRQYWAWRWWMCLSALVLLAGVGMRCYSILIPMMLYPEKWTNSQPLGGMAVVGGTFFLVPSGLLIWHLLACRPKFTVSSVSFD